MGSDLPPLIPMSYTTEDYKSLLEQYGEMTFVLDSGVEYDVHTRITEFDVEEDVVRTEGINDENEYVQVTFPTDAIEHFYTHREV